MEPTSATRRKLNEAAFLLEKLETEYWQPGFDPYLSSFITSARSVTWIMRREYGSVEGWKSWHDSVVLDVTEKDFLQRINAIRIRAEKIAPLRSRGRMVMHVTEESSTPELAEALRDFGGERIEITFTAVPAGEQADTVVSEDSIQFQAEVEDVVRTLPEFPGEDILVACKRYHQWLSGSLAK